MTSSRLEGRRRWASALFLMVLSLSTALPSAFGIGALDRLPVLESGGQSARIEPGFSSMRRAQAGPAARETVLPQRLQQADVPYVHAQTWPMPPLNFRTRDLAIAKDGSVFMAGLTVPDAHRFGPDGAYAERIRPPEAIGEVRYLTLEASSVRDEVYLLWSRSTEDPKRWQHWIQVHAGDGTLLREARMIQSQFGIVQPVELAETRPGHLLLVVERNIFPIDLDTAVSDGALFTGAEFDRAQIAGFSDGGYALGPARAQGLGVDVGWLRTFDANGQAEVTIAITDAVALDISRDRDDGLMVLAGVSVSATLEASLRRYDRGGQLVEIIDVGAPDGLETEANYAFVDRSESGIVLSHRAANHGIAVLEHDGALRWTRDRWRGPRVYESAELIRELSRAQLPLDALPQVGAMVLDARGLGAELFELKPGQPLSPALATGLDTGADLTVHPDGRSYLSPPGQPVCRIQDGGCSRTQIDCGCPDGGRIDAGGGPGQAGLFLTRPRARELRVADLGLDEVVGRFEMQDNAGAWPGDVAALPGGAVFIADPVLSQVQRFRPDGRFTVLYGQPDLERAPRRIAAARLTDGRDVVAVLQADDSVAMMDAETGGWIAEFSPTTLWPDIGKLDDVALDPDGALYVSDVSLPSVHAFAPAAGSVPTPDPQPTPVPTAVEAGCRIERDKIAFPRRIQLGETATVRLTLRADCQRPGTFVGADIVVVLDANTQFRSRGRRETYQGQMLALEQAVATAFIRGLDVRRHRVGIAAYSASQLTGQALTTDVFGLIDAVQALLPAPPNATEGPLLALLESAGRRLADEGRPDALPVILLLSDGRDLRSVHDRDRQDLSASLAYAEQLRAGGALIFTAQMETGVDSMRPGDSGEDYLRELAGSDSRFARVADAREAEPLARRIYALMRELGAASLDGNLVIHDQMAPDIELMQGSASPRAIEGPDWLIWRRGLLPSTGITLTYTITPTRTGILPTNAFAFAEYDDFDGVRRSVAFPVPEIEVWAPTPTPTPTPLPSPTAETRFVYLPFLAKGHCFPGTQHSDVVLVLDASMSMLESSRSGRPKIEAASEAVRVFLGLLDFPRDRAALVSFNAEVETLAGLTPEEAALLGALTGVRNSAGTRIHLGIEAGSNLLLSDRSRPRSQKVLILLTDGRSNPEPVAVAEAAAGRAKAAGILIYTIGLGAEVEADALRRMASHPAAYHHAPDAEDLAAVYRSLARELPCRP